MITDYYDVERLTMEQRHKLGPFAERMRFVWKITRAFGKRPRIIGIVIFSPGQPPHSGQHLKPGTAAIRRSMQ
jgi:hypothetical protein